MSAYPEAVHGAAVTGTPPAAAFARRVAAWHGRRSPLAATLLELLAMDAALFAVAVALYLVFGVKIGNSGASEFVRDMRAHVWLYAVLGAAVLPAVEELVFRGPALLLRNRLSVRAYYAVGGVSAAAFAAAHGLATLAVPQFFFGLLMWRVVRLRGFRYAVAAHVATDAVFVSVALMDVSGWL
jgi:membrane protease YdiL (CAAX protease family)